MHPLIKYAMKQVGWFILIVAILVGLGTYYLTKGLEPVPVCAPPLKEEVQTKPVRLKRGQMVAGAKYVL